MCAGGPKGNDSDAVGCFPEVCQAQDTGTGARLPPNFLDKPSQEGSGHFRLPLVIFPLVFALTLCCPLCHSPCPCSWPPAGCRAEGAPPPVSAPAQAAPPAPAPPFQVL